MNKTEHRFTAFAYSGQGSSFSGMGLTYKENPIFAKRVQIADHYCNQMNVAPVSEYLYAKHDLSPIESLSRGNRSLYVYQVALTEALLRWNTLPDFFFGHSFGEYSTWVLSGAIPFGEGMKLVLKRDQVCPPLNKAGFMLVVQSDCSSVESVLGNKMNRLSVINHEKQFVLSLPWEELLETEEELRKSKIAYKRLLSPQPYHSRELRESAKELARFSKDLVGIESPRSRFYSPSMAQWVERESFSKELLAEFVEKQLCEPYDFVKTLKQLKQHLSKIIIFSPTSSLSQLLKINFPTEEVTLGSASELVSESKDTTKLAPTTIAISSKSVAAVNKVISRITGYKIEDIKLESRLSDDLGLDSIKTAEIVFEYMDEMKVSQTALREARLGQLLTVKDLVLLAEKAGDVLEGEKRSSLSNEEVAFEWGRYHWESAPLQVISTFLPNQEPSALIDLRTIQIDELYCRLQKSTAIILPKCELSDFNGKECQGFLKTFCEKVKENLKKVESLALLSEEGSSDLLEILTPFFRSLKKEGVIKNFTPLIFDVIPSEAELSSVLKIEKSLGSGETALYIKGKRHIEKFKAEVATFGNSPVFNCIIAVGGSRGITFEILKSFPKGSIKKLHLIGRTAEAELDSISVLKSTVEEFTYHCLDAANEDELLSVLTSITLKSKIDLLLNASGIELSREFTLKSDEEILLEFKSKVFPAVSLARAVKSLPIEKVWHHSSIIGRYGNAGQSIYALANKTAEVLLKDQFTFAWPPWKDTGMTKKPSTAVFLKSTGVGLIHKKAGYEIFHETVRSKKSGNYAAVTQDLPLYKIPLSSRESRANCDIEVQKGSPGFVFSYAKNDKFLKDHIYKGTTLFPMAAAVSLCLSSSYAVYLEPVRLRNFKILKPLPVTSDGQIRIAIRGKAEMLAIDLLAQGVFSEVIADPFKLAKAELVLTLKEDRKFQGREVYHPEFLFHGPFFQTLEEVKVGKNELLATINPSTWIQSCELGEYGNFTQLIDAGLQLGAVGAWTLYDMKCLPVGFRALEYSENFDMGKLKSLYLRNAIVAKEQFFCDLSACDALGNILLSITRVTFSRIPNSPTP